MRLELLSPFLFRKLQRFFCQRKDGLAHNPADLRRSVAGRFDHKHSAHLIRLAFNHGLDAAHKDRDRPVRVSQLELGVRFFALLNNEAGDLTGHFDPLPVKGRRVGEQFMNALRPGRHGQE